MSGRERKRNMAIDTDKLQEMTGKVLADIGVIFHAPLVLIGEKLGLFKELAAATAER